MKELEAAIERLRQAVERLATAADARQTGTRRLAADLKREQAERAELQSLTDTIAGRLDGAIERLRSTLDN
jgi:chromosome segregation ATPase